MYVAWHSQLLPFVLHKAQTAVKSAQVIFSLHFCLSAPWVSFFSAHIHDEKPRVLAKLQGAALLVTPAVKQTHYYGFKVHSFGRRVLKDLMEAARKTT